MFLDVKYGNEIKENLFWPEVKKAYIMLLTEHRQPELAESFSIRLQHRF